MSLSDHNAKPTLPPGYSTISTYHPPDRFPHFYPTCATCGLLFYTRCGFTHCPSCLNTAERELTTRYKLKRAP